ncbi:MAG: hypothetical protein K2X26_02390 [Chitinophagaceae bacterium]|jgi:hypothetical protein|nr:hypothetical protein [Chitinophagaceae bacterium]
MKIINYSSFIKYVKSSLPVKFLLLAISLYAIYHFYYVSFPNEQAIKIQYNKLSSLRGDSNLSEAENFERYTRRKAEINNEIKRLEAKRLPWLNIFVYFFIWFASYQIRIIYKALHKERRLLWNWLKQAVGFKNA